jgi:phycoerythrin-associated linker protein
MNSTFLNSSITKISTGVSSDADNYPIELFSNASLTETELVIRAVYRQVLGNAHIMESERLTVAESQLKLGEITVREFVRWVAKSELYKSRFIDNCPRYRSHELNFKHLLGRAPDGYGETFYHSQILDSQGYEADIDSYLDSDEYQAAFGDNIVPYYRGYQTQTGKKLLGYTNMFKMLESLSTSDKAGRSGNAPRLVAPLILNNPGGNVPVTDINQLLREVLKPKPQSTTQFVPYMSKPETSEEKSEDNIAREIADLEAQLTELRSLASIGAAGVSKWQSYYSDLDSTSNSSSSWKTNSSQTKQQRIADLKQQIAQAQSLASLGEARLNKWRGRFF